MVGELIELEYSLTPIYTNSGFTHQFYKVNSLRELRTLSVNVPLYDDNAPYTKPYNQTLFIEDLLDLTDKLDTHTLKVIDRAKRGELPIHMVKVGHYHRLGKRIA